MKAAVYYKANDIRIENVADAPLSPHQVRIKVKWCGICGTDLHDYQAGPIEAQHGSPHPLTGQMTPLALGHEFSGEITEVGSDCINDLKPGDRVTCDPCYYCKQCEPCRFGRYNSCEKLGFIGLASWGAFAEYVIVEDYQVYRIPDEMTYEQGAIVEPACVALHGVRRSGISLGDVVTVVGLGPIGLLAAQCAKAAGAAKVYGIDNNPMRLESALDLGCDEVFDFTKTDPVAEVKNRTGGMGAHVCIDANGSDPTMQTAINATRHMGTITTLGESGSFNVNIMSQLNFPERKIIASHVYNYEFDRCISLICDGRILTAPLVTAKVFLDDIVKDGFQELCNNPEQHIKILVTPDKSLL